MQGCKQAEIETEQFGLRYAGMFKMEESTHLPGSRLWYDLLTSRIVNLVMTTLLKRELDPLLQYQTQKQACNHYYNHNSL